MKKYLIVLTMIMALILAGCGASDNKAADDNSAASADLSAAEIQQDGSSENESADNEGAGSGGQAENAVIVIDAGHQRHGNSDQEPVGPGASETKAKVTGGTAGVSTGIPEYELTLDISEALKSELENRGYSVIMTRESNDVDISNSERAEIANKAEADVFIRIHANGSENSSAAGAMTICQTKDNPYNGDVYEMSRLLSQCVLDEYTAATGIAAEKLWETDTMSGINWSEVPVTILEMGYMSNPDEDEKMASPEFRGKMVGGIVSGIEKYLKEREN